MEIEPIDPEFVRIWSRVKGTHDAPSEPENSDHAQWEAFLTGKIRSELQRRRDYRGLGLAAPARDSLVRAKKLSGVWFLLSGVRYLPAEAPPGNPRSGRGASIRQLYQSEQLSERDYIQAQAQMEDADLKAILADCAQSCQITRQSLWRALIC